MSTTTKAASNPFPALEARLMEWQVLGIERFADGAVKIGRVPHVAPLACLHTILAPLEEYRLLLMQELLRRPLPATVADFYLSANGFKAFSGSIGMYGMTRDTKVVRRRADLLPYDILIPNRHERPRGLAPENIIIGSYSFDGTQVYVQPDGSIGACKRENGAVELRRWESFDEWLITETTRVEKLFDPDGRLLTNAESTLP